LLLDSETVSIKVVRTNHKNNGSARNIVNALWEFAIMIKLILAASPVLAVLSSTLPAFAQAAPEEEQSGISDIVVTAQRRNESVQDVPIAITALSSDDLTERGITNTLGLGSFVPNLLAFNNTGLGSANGYYLRGLGNTESIATFDPPVGTYVDDIYLSRQNANNLSFFDVDRIEVLRGPQGTLFGRNTTGGAINVIMKDPGDTLGGFAEVGYGRFDKTLARASIDIPLAPTFGVKISGFWQNDKGYVKNVTTGDRLNDDDGWGVRLGIKGQLSDKATWRGSFAHIVSNGENILNFECNPASPSDCDGRFATTGLPEGRRISPSVFAPLAISGRKANFGNGNYTQNNIVTSNLGYEFSEAFNLNIITGFVNLRQQFALDFFDGRGGPSISTPNPAVRGFARGGFTIINDGKHDQITQELKASGTLASGLIDYVAGAYFFRETNTTDFADTFTLFFPGLPGNQLPLLLADRTLKNRTTAKAGYVQADFNISEQFKVTAGVRYTDERKHFTITDNRAVCRTGPLATSCIDNLNMVVLPPVVPARASIPTNQATKLWTPRFALNFKPSNDLLFFASATRGFKSGGWNARGTAASELLPFGPEKVWSYEAGVKSDLFDRRVRANLTVYYQDTSDLQTPSAFVRANGTLAFITRNFADYVNKGAELELTFQPVDNLNLYFNAGYQDDKYKIDANAPAIDAFGVRSVAAQQALCLASLAAGNIAGGPNTTNCGAGIVAPDGSIATPVRTPKWTLAMGGSYKAELGGSGWSVTPSINASYASRSETGTSEVNIFSGSVTGTNGTFPANLTSGDFIVGSRGVAHWLFNAGLTLSAPDDRIQLSVNCTNCFGESFIQSSLANYSYLNRPSEWMVRAKYNF
jgi:iron complex outermembrane recepter protein